MVYPNKPEERQIPGQPQSAHFPLCSCSSATETALKFIFLFLCLISTRFPSFPVLTRGFPLASREIMKDIMGDPQINNYHRFSKAGISSSFLGPLTGDTTEDTDPLFPSKGGQRGWVGKGRLQQRPQLYGNAPKTSGWGFRARLPAPSDAGCLPPPEMGLPSSEVPVTTLLSTAGGLGPITCFSQILLI